MVLETSLGSSMLRKQRASFHGGYHLTHGILLSPTAGPVFKFIALGKP